MKIISLSRKSVTWLLALGTIVAMMSLAACTETTPGISGTGSSETGISAPDSGEASSSETASSEASQPDSSTESVSEAPSGTLSDMTSTFPSSVPSSSASSSTTSSSSVVSVIPTPPVREYYSSQLGIWYELFYGTGVKYPERWDKESRSTPVEDGFYRSYDMTKIEKDFRYLKRIGFDYLVLDDTNYHLADNGTIAMAADNCFIVADKLGKSAPVLCFAGGRPLIEGKEDMMLAELNIFYGYYKKYPDNYHIWDGKPLFINFNNPSNLRYNDPLGRFTMRGASGLVSNTKPYAGLLKLNVTGIYGWCFDDQYIGSEVYGITAGWSRSHNDMVEFHGPISRENGKRFQRMWLEAVKVKPKTIVITGWNEHVEETGIEAVTLREPVEGREKEHLNPFYYQQMTEGYIALKRGYLENFYYQSEDSDQIYQYKGGKLVKVASVPEMTAVILVPDDYYDWSDVKFG